MGRGRLHAAHNQLDGPKANMPSPTEGFCLRKTPPKVHYRFAAAMLRHYLPGEICKNRTANIGLCGFAIGLIFYRHRWSHRVIHWEWQIHEWSVFAVLILQFFPQKLVPLGLCLCLSVPRMCIQLRCFSSSRCAPAIEQQNLPGVCLLKSIMFGSKC